MPSRKSRGRVRELAMGTVVGSVCVVSFLIASPPRAAGPTGWDVVWADDFDGPSGASPDARNWMFDLGNGYPGGPPGWGNAELENYTASPENAALDGQGHLVITARRSPVGEWTSARLESVRSDFAPPPGGSLRIEARLSLPVGGRGYWPAFWMLGAPFRDRTAVWPATGEIDVMENVSQGNDIHGTLHCVRSPGGPCGEPQGRGNSLDLGTARNGMHVYSLQWDTAPQRLSWAVDGHTYGRLGPADLGAEADAWRSVVGHGYFMLLDLAVGGNWPGYPDLSTAATSSMVVDWVRVSRRGAPTRSQSPVG